MGVSVSGTIDQKTYLKNLGGLQPPYPPLWIRLWPNTRRCTSNYGNRCFAACTAVLPTLRFSRKFGLVFLSSCGLFQDLRVACFIWNLLVFYKFAFCKFLFFQISWHFWSFNLLLRAIWACFCENLLILDLFLLICLIPAFLFNFPADSFFCWIFLQTHVGLVFRLNYLFWAFVSNYLPVFAKQPGTTDVQWLFHADILTGNVARQWLLIAVSHVGLYRGWPTCLQMESTRKFLTNSRSTGR